ncbi:nucleoside deaminase [Deinococcus cavernae]|uniref:nucleoside deaminase n=1 Tax=Deinococcus cavernae TaxID=2320857 RepID=UPI001F1B9B10|nr:deaminase [Deinococcus cavernae]
MTQASFAGSYAIGACIVDASGQVPARGRNRLSDPRGAHGGVIGGHDLAHAEINALLNLPATPRPECYGWTVLTTVEPCPQCAGAVRMSGIRALEYAAPDPWAGCARLLTDDPYVRRKEIRVGRAPTDVQRLATRLALVSFLDEGHDTPDSMVFRAYQAVTPDDVQAALAVHTAGHLPALRAAGASLAAALDLLNI